MENNNQKKIRKLVNASFSIVKGDVIICIDYEKAGIYQLFLYIIHNLDKNLPLIFNIGAGFNIKK